jgi:lipoprotein NlpD
MPVPWPRLCYLAIALLLSCSNNPPAPIETRQGVTLEDGSGAVTPELAHAPKYGGSLDHGEPYTVQEGDTLYAIAFRLGADYRLLARANDIAPPYLIFPGQTLSTIDPVAGSVVDGSETVALSHTPVPKAVEVRSKSQQKPVSQPQLQTQPAAKPQPAAPKGSVSTSAAKASGPGATPSKVTSSPPPTKAIPVAKAPTPQVKAVVGGEAPMLGPVTRWLWPGKGPVERAYSAVLHKGIDIAGQRGDPVYATAAGVVVYAGTGLKGYGALLIVKHNDQFLSAYGHNDVMLVAEGANIRAGQQLARMGSSGTDTVKLHFEIRRKGQPVDPLRLLPRR